MTELEIELQCPGPSVDMTRGGPQGPSSLDAPGKQSIIAQMYIQHFMFVLNFLY